MPSQKPKVFARIAAACVFFVGLMVLLGWTFDVATLKSILPGWPKVSPGTMLAFLLSSISLWCVASAAEPNPPAGNARRLQLRVSRMFSVAVAIIGLCRLGDYALGWNLNIDTLGFQEALAAGESSARMAQATALAFFLVGCALFLAGCSRGFVLFQFLVLTTGLVGWLGFSRYLYGGEPLLPYSQMSAITAFCFLLLSGGTFCVRADGGLMALILSDSSGGLLVRRLLPAALVMPFVLGWLRLKAQHAGWFGMEAGLALFALSLAVLFAALIWAAAIFLHRADLTRRQAEMASIQLAAIVGSSDDAIIGKDLNSVITSWNRGAENIFGYTSGEMVGTSILRLIPADRQEEEAKILENVGRGESLEHFETVRQTRDGRLIDVSITVSPIKDAAGRVIGVSKVARDITEARRAQEALRDSEERFRTMANSIPQLAWIAQADGFIFWYNRRWYEYTGTTPAQMEGWGWQSVHDPQVLPKVMQKWKAAIDSAQPFDMEFPLRGADGQFRMFLTRIHPLKDSEGRVVNWFGTNTDVDVLKRMEDSLRATQAQLSSALAAGSIGTWTWDIGNDRLTADEFTARAFSIEADAAAKGLPAAAYLQAVLEEDQPAVSDALGKAIQSCGHYDIEYRVRQKGGEPLWLHARGRVDCDAAGNALSFHGAVMDVTARKLAEAAVRKSEDHFRFLNDVMEASRPLADPGKIMEVMARMLGEHLRASRCAYADVEEDGEQFTILHDYTDGCASTVGQYQLSLFGARAVATLHSGQTLIIRNVEAELLSNEGAAMFNAIGIKAIITCPLVKDGILRAMMAVHQTTPRDWKANEIAMVQDVVERCWATIERRAAEDKVHQLNVELEQRVIERTAQLEAVNRELEAFSYSVSHDLRAPLRAVDGYSHVVLEDYASKLPDEGRRQLQMIRDGAQRMGALIDDLLTFAQLNRRPLRKQTVDAGKLVRDTLEELQAQREGRRVEIHTGDLPPCQGDPALLKQVWINLLANALKYTRKRDPAVIEIGCRQEKGANAYFVHDNGTGFDMRYVDKLFGVFQRLHRSEDFEGTGVGLAIVQRIVNRHGGRVWADAAVDRGATFYFTLEGEIKR